MIKTTVIVLITLGLVGCSAHIQSASDETVKQQSGNTSEVFILDKGVKRVMMVPKDVGLKEGVIVKFKNLSHTSITDFEHAYGLKLEKKLVSSYYIFANVSPNESDVQIVTQIITDEKNVETVRPNWKMTNKPQQ